jgi:hypothetical protein
LIRQLSFTEQDRQKILDIASELIESRADANLDLNDARSEIKKILLRLPSCDDEPEESAFDSNGNREEALQRCKCNKHCTPNNVNELDANLKEGEVCVVGNEEKTFKVYYHSRSILEKMAHYLADSIFAAFTGKDSMVHFMGFCSNKAQDSAAPISYNEASAEGTDYWEVIKVVRGHFDETRTTFSYQNVCKRSCVQMADSKFGWNHCTEPTRPMQLLAWTVSVVSIDLTQKVFQAFSPQNKDSRQTSPV